MVMAAYAVYNKEADPSAIRGEKEKKMNHVILMGRLVRDPDYHVNGKGKNELAICRYTLAVDRDKDNTDFIGCVCFGKTADFANDYLSKGTKIAIEGRIQTGKYENKDGDMVYTTDVVVSRHEFCESRKKSDEDEDSGSRRKGSR